jgi:hypothetical protein
MSKIGKGLSNVCFKAFAIATIGISSLVSGEFSLTVSPEREEVIEEIVTTMATTWLPMLKFKETHLKDLSKKLEGMGSFNFLGYIFTHSDLRDHMHTITESSIKFDKIMGNVRKGLERAKNAGTIWEDIPGFAALLEVEADELTAFAHKSNWDGLVRYLDKNVR